ncbi:MAG: A/G-specific adenine glycosylase [Hyphomicrobiaceae bacterium]|nr:A/G-specific adenine glycosylase [Hyphomicrobiaceae bacterium]
MPPTRPDPAALLHWYDRHARRLPWRVAPADRAEGEVPDPYRVWLSEIMLQQTTVAAVKPYFEAFVGRWPTVAALAAADEADVMKAWAGLGYYSRARNLEACAKAVARDHGGRFPDSEAGLLALPGIGPYTAAAIAAIAFDRPATVVDGNVERVISRLYRVEAPLPGAKPEIRALAAGLTPARRPGDYAQAVMDLGATICTPKRPACGLCPWRDACAGQAAGDAEAFPRKAAKAERPTRSGEAFVCRRDDGAILLRRRPPEGLLGGMSEVPTSDWTTPKRGRPGAVRRHGAPVEAAWRAMPGKVEHTFTHFHLVLTIKTAGFALDFPAPEGHWWSKPEALAGEALPSVMRKAIDAAIG